LYYSTIRSRELCNLNIEDIDFQRQKIRTISKGGHFDERNLHPDCLKAIGDYLALKEQPKEGHEKALFLNSKGERIGRTYLHLMIQKCASKAGINKRVYAHLFRASSITHMHNAGASIPEIMAQSKHRSVETLVKHYICPSEERYKEVYLNTLSFDNTTIDQKHKKEDPSNIQHKPQASELQQQLVQKLAQGEITNDVFIQAIRLLSF
jgi:site-specific recombinase XerD